MRSIAIAGRIESLADEQLELLECYPHGYVDRLMAYKLSLALLL